MSPLQNPEISTYHMPAMEVVDPADVVAAAEQIARQSIIAEQQPGYGNVGALAMEQGIATTSLAEVAANQPQAVEALQPQYNAQADRAAAVQDARSQVLSATTSASQETFVRQQTGETLRVTEATPEYLRSFGENIELFRQATLN